MKKKIISIDIMQPSCNIKHLVVTAHCIGWIQLGIVLVKKERDYDMQNGYTEDYRACMCKVMQNGA